MSRSTDSLIVTVSPTKLIISQNGLSIAFNGEDIVKAAVLNAPKSPDVNTVDYSQFVRLYLTGTAREALGEHYDLFMRDVSSPSSWNDKVDPRAGALIALAAIQPMIRSLPSGGGGGQVDTIVPGDAIDVDSTDPVNPIVSVKVDGVTIGFNGSNELEVPAGGGGYVPTTRLINTTAPLAGGGNLSADRTLTHQNSGVVAGSYTNASVTVNATGHVTAAASGTAPVTSVGATYPIQSSGGATPTISADTSTGGNGSLDGGKLVEFQAPGSIYFSNDNGGSPSISALSGGAGDGLYATSDTGDAVHAVSSNGKGIHAIAAGTEPAVHANGQGSEVALEVEQNGTPGTDLCLMHDGTGNGLEVKTDGGLEWTSATGAQTTADNLPVFGAATQGVVPAAGAVPAATNFLTETGAWAVPAGTGVTAVSVTTANGLAGSSSGGATPALTLSTTVTGVLSGNGTAISAASTTGSGSVVLATSPVLTTPNLGTPSALVLTNATGLPIAGGGTGQSTQTAAFDALAPTTTKGDIIANNGTDNVRLAAGTNGQVLVAESSASEGARWEWRPVSFPVIFGLNAVAIAITTTETVYNSTTVHQIKRDLTNYRQARLVVNRGATAGPTGAKAILKYRNGDQSTTVANFSDLGTSEISCNIVSANTQAISSWIDITASAKTDVLLTVTLVCSSGTASPSLGAIEIQVR